MSDVLVIGKGPAGISTAVYLARAGFNVSVIGKDGGALSKTGKIENYYGFEEPISGPELLKRGEMQAKRLGVNIIDDEIVSIKKENDFELKSANNLYNGKAVLISTGKSRHTLNIEGFDKLNGSGISFCAVCDGFFFRNKSIAVIGNGDYMANEVDELLKFSKDVTVFTDGKELSTQKLNKDIKVIKEKLKSIKGSNFVEAIETENGIYKIDAIFVAIGTANAADFAKKLGVLVKENNIVVDKDYMTNINGLFAAGDCIGGFLQISKAVSDGAIASIGIGKYLKSLSK